MRAAGGVQSVSDGCDMHVEHGGTMEVEDARWDDSYPEKNP